jgi:hypothetical protein
VADAGVAAAAAAASPIVAGVAPASCCIRLPCVGAPSSP